MEHVEYKDQLLHFTCLKSKQSFFENYNFNYWHDFKVFKWKSIIDQNTTEAIINDEMDKMEAEHEPIIKEVIDDAMGSHTVWKFEDFSVDTKILRENNLKKLVTDKGSESLLYGILQFFMAIILSIKTIDFT